MANLERYKPKNVAHYCEWRQKCKRGWSKILYRGLRVWVNDIEVLVADLPHGIRAVELTHHMDTYKFIRQDDKVLSMSDEFIVLVEVFVRMDETFQSLVGREFQEVLKKIPRTS